MLHRIKLSEGISRRVFTAHKIRLLFVLAALVIASLAAAAQTADEFTIVVLPDTQNYSEFRPEIFRAQTEWIAANREKENIKLVLGVGDIVNHGSIEAEWRNADAAIDVLDAAGVPYLLAIGNHDYDNHKPSTRSAVLFNHYFGPARYANAPHYSGSYPEGSNENFYGTMEINGQKYLLLALEFNPRQAVIDWAAEILAAHADKQAIVFTHSYMYDDDSRVGRCDKNNATSYGLQADNDGDETWDKLISRHANIGLVLSGHIHTTDGAGRIAQLGMNGNLVNQILSDYQHLPDGGGGYLRIMRFRPSANTIEVTTYSPYLNTFLPGPEHQFTVAMQNNGQNANIAGSVKGKVRASDCQPLSGASVSHGSNSVSTDFAGNYELPGPEGLQSLSAQISGYETATQTAEVTPGWPVYKDFFLRPDIGCSPDTSAPSATICAPLDGASVSSPVKVLAAGYSPDSIIRLELWVDGVKRHQVHSDRMDTSFTATAGSRRITVVAVEPGGATFKRTVNVTVSDDSSGPCTLSTADPSVTVCMPTNQATVASPVRIVAGTTSSSPVIATKIYVDHSRVYSVNSGQVDTTLPMAAGTHFVTVQAWNNAGAIFKKSVTINVTSGEPPTGCSAALNSMNICTPTDNATVSSPVSVLAAANSSAGISYSQVYVDGVKKYEIFSSNINTAIPMAAGTRRLTVQARDKAGVFLKKTIFITVR